ncbi:hypothetical protein E2C01_079794 [Portunus trituberculatus]|uniref:Uncharacterized protein n=1 Tax=Portunus trituberculatus TaxID=210409 RepID=A0A5B7ITR3_PORTR|nr:hypothetical protein [Portunus trituberculatus]
MRIISCNDKQDPSRTTSSTTATSFSPPPPSPSPPPFLTYHHHHHHHRHFFLTATITTSSSPPPSPIVTILITTTSHSPPSSHTHRHLLTLTTITSHSASPPPTLPPPSPPLTSVTLTRLGVGSMILSMEKARGALLRVWVWAAGLGGRSSSGVWAVGLRLGLRSGVRRMELGGRCGCGGGEGGRAEAWGSCGDVCLGTSVSSSPSALSLLCRASVRALWRGTACSPTPPCTRATATPSGILLDANGGGLSSAAAMGLYCMGFFSVSPRRLTTAGDSGAARR